MQGYATVKVGNIPPKKLKKALEGNAIRLTNAELKGDRVMVVNKLNEKAIKKAQNKGAGLTTHFTPDEARRDMEYHRSMGAGMHGGSIWDTIKGGLKWLGTQALNGIADASKAAVGPALSPLVDVARGGVEKLTGLGVKRATGKGTPEMKAKMAAIRAKRKGGSFRMA